MHFWRPIGCVWQQTRMHCSYYRMPKNNNNFFSTHSQLSGQPENNTKTSFSHSPSPFPCNHCQYWHLYCFTILGSTPNVIHSVEQRLLRNRLRSDAATFRNLLRERLQRAFTHTNQLHWTAQYTLCIQIAFTSELAICTYKLYCAQKIFKKNTSQLRWQYGRKSIYKNFINTSRSKASCFL